MRRATLPFDSNFCPLRLEEINVPFGAGIIYRDKVISIIDLITMREIRRSLWLQYVALKTVVIAGCCCCSFYISMDTELQTPVYSTFNSIFAAFNTLPGLYCQERIV